MKTIGSCQGHATWLANHVKPPYVYFTAPVTFATQLAKKLHPIDWTLVAQFNHEHDLCFRLQSRRYEAAHKSLIPFQYTYFLGYHRNRVDQELLQLSQWVLNIKLASVNQEIKNEPHEKNKTKDISYY